MAKEPRKSEVTVEPEFHVSNETSSWTIRSFETAWALSLELPTPVNAVLRGWVRKDA